MFDLSWPILETSPTLLPIKFCGLRLHLTEILIPFVFEYGNMWYPVWN